MTHTLTQAQLELRMAEVGYTNTRSRILEAESTGHADRNPYSSTIYRDYVQPLAALIQEDLDKPGAARLRAHIALLSPLDPWAVAYLAVRTSLTSILGGEEPVTVRWLCYKLGQVVHAELYLAQFQEMAPDLYFTIAEDLGRRRAVSEEYRYSMFRKQAKAKGMEYVEWKAGHRDQVGALLLELMRTVGLLDMDIPSLGPGRRPPLGVYLTAPVMDLVENITETVAIMSPAYGPCVEQPIPWTSWTEGGWHTRAMKRALPYPVKARSEAREKLRGHSMPTVLGALNSLQETAWQVNSEVLDVVAEVAKTHVGGEFSGDYDSLKPEPLAWFDHDLKERTPEQEAELKQWKSEMTIWHTQNKLARQTRLRAHTALRIAREYRGCPEIFFVYFADSRGRLYPMTQGISPQGSDLQRGLLRFAKGEPLDTDRAVFWFKYNGANLWGYDKDTPDGRVAWVDRNHDQIIRTAQNPLDNREWLQADSPVQFLAWCMEYGRWMQDPRDFLSHLPVALDGSCSGLQHYSAMLRDEIGGAATNLTYSPVMRDIYAEVAQATTDRLRAAEEDPEGLRQVWLAHGINRQVTKRATMTTPYNVTKRGATRYIIEDYLNKHALVPTRTQYRAASYIMDFIWPAIGDVVVKAREGMDYLDKAAREIVAQSGTKSGTITWSTPSGFLASQSYYVPSEHRVPTMLFGHKRIKVLSESVKPSPQKHSLGLAPNFIHSMDASHMHLTIQEVNRVVPGTSLAMIHDSFGTHARYTQVMYDSVRSTFLTMYRDQDPLQDLASQYNLPEPPAKGSLELTEVLDSLYAFA